MLSLGIDSGSTTTKGILFDGTEIVSALLVPTTARPKESLNTVYKALSQNVSILLYKEKSQPVSAVCVQFLLKVRLSVSWLRERMPVISHWE